MKSKLRLEKLRLRRVDLSPRSISLAGFFQDQVPLANNEDSFRRNNFLVGLEVNWAIWDSSKK